MSNEPPERPEEDLGWLLATVSHRFTAELTSRLEAVSVTPRAHCVLATAMKGEYTQTALAQAIGLDKTTMVVTIDALERSGLVERRTSSEDRRVRVIAVTEAGRRRVQEGEAIVAEVQADVLGSLPAPLRDGLVRALQSLAGDRLCDVAGCSQPVRRPRSVAAGVR